MATTNTSDPTRTGAVWVTATGSFLLFAAAVTLVAIRWDTIPDGVKLGALALLSGGLLVLGRPGSALADRHAPAAADVLFHLGAFLTPVTASAVLIHLEVPRDTQLLGLGLASAALFHVLGRLEGSVVLGWATLGATVVAAAGAGGLTPVPATAWLVALGALALVARLHHEAIVVSTMATVVPLAAVLVENADPGSVRDSWYLDQLVGAGITPGFVGLTAAVVLVALTHRLRSLPLLAVAATALSSGLATTALQVEPAASTWWVAAAAGFVLVELATMLLRHDPFWRRPLVEAAGVTEAFATLPLVVAAFAPVVVRADRAEPMLGAALGLSAVAWFLADLRRQPADDAPGLGLLIGGGFGLGTIGATLSTVGAVAAATASMPLTAAVAGALAIALVVSGRPASPVLVPGLVLVATTLLANRPVVSGLVAATGALLVAFQATLHHRSTAEPLALVALVPALAALVQADRVLPFTAVLVGGLGLAWALAVMLDQARSGDRLGWTARLAGTALLLTLVDEGAGTIAAVTVTYLALATVEALRRDDPWPLLGWAIGVPPLAASLAVLAGLSLTQSAVVLAALAVPVAAASQRWEIVGGPLLATALSLAASGVTLAADDPGVLGTVLLLDGAVAVALALLTDKPALLTAGGASAVVGAWIHLDLGGVEAVDAYALPVAVLLWLVATRVADEAVSSWATHAPAVALAGGTALAERIGGGPGEHALLAGAVGVLAVLEGGGRRLAAPLLLGTGLLVALTANETTVVTAGVPTWAWLAAAGALLVGAGLAMEHHQLGPVESGRRLVDVVNERFS